MDAFLIIMVIVTCAIFLIVDIYITVIYSHREESKKEVKNILCLILIMITLLQIEFQPLFLIVDVINSRDSATNLTTFWEVLFFSILTNLGLVKPIVTSIYESDEDDPLWKRILWITAETLISLAAFGVFLGIGWLICGYFDLDFTQKFLDSDTSITDTSQYIDPTVFESMTSRHSYIQLRLTVPCFLVALFCLLGYPILICCGSCGLTALPISLIMEYKSRPKYRRTAEARKVTDHLKQQTVELITLADKLRRSMTRIEFVDGWWARRQKKLQIEQAVKEVEERFLFHQDYYELFRLELKMQDVNPLVYVGKLVLGILCIIASVMLWVQIMLAHLVFPADEQSGSVFLDSFFLFMEEENANFISIAVLMLICVYFSCSIIKGTMFFSNNVPFVTIHPMVEQKTWLNSFLFQLTLIVLSSAALVHMFLGTFPYYLRGGEIALMMGHILDGMLFIKIFIANKVFIYSYLVMTGLGGLYVTIKLVCFSQGKTELLLAIEEKRNKLFGKKHNQKPIHEIEMTEMHLKDHQKQVKEVKENNKSRKKPKKVKLVPF